MTILQKSILELVLSTRKHLTAEHIFLALKERHPQLAIGTVYRNLSLFADAKKIRRIVRPDGPDLFEGNLTPHEHGICRICGKAVDIRADKLKEYLSADTDFEIESFDLVLSGLCAHCGKRSAEASSKKE